MRIHYALYDPSNIGPFGNYWSWKSDSIPKDLMEEIYYTYLIKNKPENPNRLTAQDLWGGVLALENWLVVYRYCDGGYDTQGRPGRYCILTGWIARGDYDSSILRALRTSAFDTLAQTMPLPCPVPQPTALEETRTGSALSLPENHDLLAQLEREPIYDYPSFDVDGALRDFITLAGMDPFETFHLKIQQQGSHAAIQLINCQTKPKPKPEPKSEPESEPEFPQHLEQEEPVICCYSTTIPETWRPLTVLGKSLFHGLVWIVMTIRSCAKSVVNAFKKRSSPRSADEDTTNGTKFQSEQEQQNQRREQEWKEAWEITATGLAVASKIFQLIIIATIIILTGCVLSFIIGWVIGNIVTMLILGMVIGAAVAVLFSVKNLFLR